MSSRVRQHLLRVFTCFAVCSFAAAAAAQAPPARLVRSLQVETPATDPAHAALAEGVAMWLRVELSAAGLPVEPRGAEAPAATRLRGELRVAAGGAELRLRLADAAGGPTLAGVSRRGRLADLGTLARDAAAALLARVALPSDALGQAIAPSLEELARAGRALAWLDAGELARARRELSGRASSLAAALIQGIDAAAAAPETPAAVRARVLLARGEVDAARTLVPAEPGPEADAETLLAAAELAREQNNPRRERDLLARAVARAPENGEAQLAYGRSLAAVNPADARPVLERAARLRADDPEPLEALAALPGAAPGGLLGAADRAAARFELARAERLLAGDRAGPPARAAEAERRAGELQLAVGDNERARVAFERAVELAPADTEAWKGLASARRGGGDRAGAESAYHEALEGAPEDAEALSGLGALQLESGRAAEARPVLERALALSPGDEATRVDLARALASEGEGERALALLEQEGGSAEPLRYAAELHLERGDPAAAGRALERAIALDPDDAALHETLAEVRGAEGSAEAASAARAQALVLDGEESVAGLAAETAGAAAAAGFDGAGFLAQIAVSFPSRNEHSRLPIQRVALLGLRPEHGWRALLERALAPQRLDLARLEADLAGALGARFELVKPGSDAPDLSAAFAAAPGRPEIARLNDALGTHALFVARVISADREPDWRGAFRGRGLEVRMLLGADADVATLLANAQGLAEAESAYATWNPIALGVYALAALLLVARLLRGWGTLVVRIDYERLGPSFFTAQLSRKPGRVKTNAGDRSRSQRRFRQKMRELGRLQRTVLGHEVRFRWIPARGWYVAVHGLLEHPLSKEVIGRYFDEKPVRVPRGKTTTVTFDFRATECSLEVMVTRQGTPLERAAVALEGVAGSLRYTHKGAASFTLGKGRHVILVGHEGRVVERRLRLEKLEPLSLAVDLADENGLVFADCPAAVESYLAGARDAAAEKLEGAGQLDVARRLRGDAAAARGDRTVAAELFEQSGRFEEAAQAWLAQRRPERAARCLERLGRLPDAAEAWRAAGDLARAGRAFEEAGEYDAALDCWAKSGERERLVALLEKTEAWFEAAQAALEDGNRDRAIASLQRLSPVHVHYVEACRKLGEIFAERGELALAIGKLEDAAAVAASEHLADLHHDRAELLLRAERLEDALEAFEDVRRRDFHRAGVAEQIESLRERVAHQRAEQETRVRTAAAPAAPQEERYQIQGELGRGGMGIVYRAFDQRLGRTIALKRLPESLREHPKIVEMFLREARAAAQLNHPNIVTVHDVDQRDGTYFITMECMEGLPLNALLRKHQRFPVASVARIGVQVCAGLGFAHARGIVHRDIKTANLFMTRDKVVKIMDFGLAKSLAEVRRAGTVIGGTPYYMAPEQAVGDTVDGRADLYALGVTFFELATGTLPWTEGELTYHHRHTPAPDPRERVADLPAALAELILELMAKTPDARPASAADVAARLKPLLRPAGKGA